MLKASTLAWVLCALLLAGCAITDHFDDRVSRFDLAAAQSRDGMILTNIVRASHAEPLSFVQLGQLSGTTQTTANLGLPALLFGPTGGLPATANEVVFGSTPTGGNSSNSANMVGTTNFQATPAETKDFYRGLLRAVDPRTLELFVQQGLARELLFYLFTDKLIEERDGAKRELRNDPLDPNFPIFQTYVRLAMQYGLSSETLPGPAPKHGAADAPDAKLEHWRLCFNRLYLEPDAPPASNAPVCGGGGASGDERTVSFISQQGARVRLRVLPRSAFGIFEYLGRIVAAGERGRIRLYSPEAIDQPPLRDEFLFVIEQGTSSDCFLGITHQGQSYCVPREGATNTKRILGLLTQLIALNTDVDTVPVAPTVRVVP